MVLISRITTNQIKFICLCYTQESTTWIIRSTGFIFRMWITTLSTIFICLTYIKSSITYISIKLTIIIKILSIFRSCFSSHLPYSIITYNFSFLTFTISINSTVYRINFISRDDCIMFVFSSIIICSCHISC